MSSPIPDVPSVLYCSIPDGNKEAETELLQSGSVQAALTRLMDASGTLRTVNYEDHLAYREVYVIQLDCMWPNEKPRTILDSKRGTTSLRSDGYDVAIQSKTRGGYRFVILNPFRVVYRVVYHPPLSQSSIVIASSSDTDASRYRRRAKNDPREPQEEVDAILLKLSHPRNPLDEISVAKVALSHRKDQVWAKDEIVAILKRTWKETRSDRGDCWRCLPARGESAHDIRLRVLFWSFGRKAPRAESGLKVVHAPSEADRDEKTAICIRPSHLHLTSAVDPQALQQTAESLSSLLGQLRLGNETQ